jgi:hypothetical protein
VNPKLCALTVAGGLVLAGCGSTSAGKSASSTVAPTTTVFAPSNSTTANSTTATSTTAKTVETSTGSTTTAATVSAPIKLTASYEGVTADNIAIGVAFIDFETLNKKFGFNAAVIPVADAYAAWAKALNASGGIHGRKVTVDARGFVPVGATESDKVCVELLEDKKSFVVIGLFLQDNMLCVTKTHGHPYVGLAGETPELQTASNGLFFATEMSLYDQKISAVRELIAGGDLKGKKLGVVWINPTDKASGGAVTKMLTDASLDVRASVEVGTMTADAVANDAAWTATLERFKSKGVDTIVNLADFATLTAVENFGSPFTVAMTHSQIAEGTRFTKEVKASDEVRDNTIGLAVYKPTLEALLADAEVKRCFAEYDAAFPNAPIHRDVVDEVTNFVHQCQGFRMTVAILKASGGDITPDSFKAAAATMGSFTLPGMADAKLGPDKHSAGSQMSRYDYDPAKKQFVAVGAPIPTGK